MCPLELDLFLALTLTFKTALIAGVTGQDGAYLTRHLLRLGYRVIGTSREVHNCNISRLSRLNIYHHIELIPLIPTDFASVLKTIKLYKPDELYNLSGESSVGLSFQQPWLTNNSIVVGTLNFLEAIRILNISTKFFNACSSECFGNTGDKSANESTTFMPLSPYAAAKATTFWQVKNYRESYQIYCCSGLLSNHESPLRANRFVTQKIVQGVRKIYLGQKSCLSLGNLDVWRDWGWAPEYIIAIHKMLQQKNPCDYIVASGHSHSLHEFISLAFAAAGLSKEEFLTIDLTLMRPSDISYCALNPSKIWNDLEWASTIPLQRIVQKMWDDEHD